MKRVKGSIPGVGEWGTIWRRIGTSQRAQEYARRYDQPRGQADLWRGQSEVDAERRLRMSRPGDGPQLTAIRHNGETVEVYEA